MQKLSDLLGESKIFADREVLSPHYIPNTLIFREKEIGKIERALAPSLKGEKGRNIFLYGKTGTGKTSCAKYVVREVEEIPNSKAKISYINCKMYNSRYRVLNKIISDHLPTYSKRGYGAIDLYEKIANWIEEDNKTLITILDEIDVVKDLDDLVYTLTRINSDMRAGGFTIVGISNNVSFKESLDPRSLSALYETEIVFPPYNATEIYAIIKDRSEKGFKKGMIDDNVLHYVAAAASQHGGDARFSLKIISRIGELAEEAQKDKITLSEAEEAIKIAEKDIVYEVIANLPEQQKIVLYAISKISKEGGSYKKLITDGLDRYIFSGEVYKHYRSISESVKKPPKSERWYRNYISELEMQGIIKTFDSGKGIRGHTKLIKLMYPPDKTQEVIENSIFGLKEVS
jgi:orc1/cdc6 family replication initiation protein